MIIKQYLFKKFYLNISLLKNNSYIFNQNKKLFNTKKSILNKNFLYNVYILNKDTLLKFKLKKFVGFLIKKTNKLNLTTLHLIQLKKYNNIHFSFYKESPNIFIY